MGVNEGQCVTDRKELRQVDLVAHQAVPVGVKYAFSPGVRFQAGQLLLHQIAITVKDVDRQWFTAPGMESRGGLYHSTGARRGFFSLSLQSLPDGRPGWWLGNFYGIIGRAFTLGYHGEDRPGGPK